MMDGFTGFLLALASYALGIITGIGIILEEFKK